MTVIFFLRSAPLFSRTSMLSVLSTVSPSALAKAWSRGDFPEEITSALKKKRVRRKVISDKLKISRFTTSVTFIHISAHFQEGRQTGQPLWLLAGKIQRTALVDLPSSIRIVNKTERRGCQTWTQRCEWQLIHPVSPLDVGSVFQQQFHHVRLVPQHGDVKRIVVRHRVWRAQTNAHIEWQLT